MSQVAHQCQSLFRFLLPLDGILIHRRVTPSSESFSPVPVNFIHMGECVGVKCLAQKQNAVPRPGLEPEPLDPESRTLTIRPTRLPQNR